MVGHLHPTSAAVGQLGVMAVNLALGGICDNLESGIKFFKALAKKTNPSCPSRPRTPA